MAGSLGSGTGRSRARPGRLSAEQASGPRRAFWRVRCPRRSIRPTSTPSRWTKKSPYPGDRAIERRIKSLIRWNAMAMVVRANKYDPGIGGHISTYASLATLTRSRPQSFLPRQLRRSARRFGLLPGPRFARRLCARVSRRPPDRKAPAKTSAMNCATSPACPLIRIPG